MSQIGRPNKNLDVGMRTYCGILSVILILTVWAPTVGLRQPLRNSHQGPRTILQIAFLNFIVKTTHTGRNQHVWCTVRQLVYLSLDLNACYKNEASSYFFSPELSFDLQQMPSVTGVLFISIEWEEIHFIYHRDQIWARDIKVVENLQLFRDQY